MKKGDKGMKRMYISTPMTGVEEEIIVKNNEIGIQFCHDCGFVAVSPLTISKRVEQTISNPTWADYMREDLIELSECSEMLLVAWGTDWRKSKGCKTEIAFARGCGIPITELHSDGRAELLIDEEPKPKTELEYFNPKTFEVFQKILFRGDEFDTWEADFLRLPYRKGLSINRLGYREVIPYNEYTKHLVGTVQDCEDYYKWWENE